jgi:enoyl-CoA hydratase
MGGQVMNHTQEALADGRLLLETHAHVARITFNNPDRLNAMTLGMWSALADVCERLSRSGDARVVVLQGAGTRAFVSGADISEFGTVRTGTQAVAHYNAEVGRAEKALSAMPVPTIAQLRGYCVGGGLGLAARCDIRICADDARFAVTPAKLGLGYGKDSVAALFRLLGPSVSADMLFTARQVHAPEALRVGLVNQVTPVGELDATTAAMASHIAANAPLTIRLIKASLKACGQPDDPATTAQLDQMVQTCYASADYREGQAAFSEKRKPLFQGK